ncbi:head-to-tail adaptor [Pseudomonas phage Dolphis]|nr:head-to-tail adaptor [Pseudomonas phage Dolphis]
MIVDARYLKNEQMAFYKPFYFDGSTWTAGQTAHGAPAAVYEEHSTDVLSFVRERLEAGLLVEVERGNLTSEIGYIQVYTAPPSLERDLRFPLVTIHLESESAADRGLGEDICGDEFDAIGFDWLESEGWLAQVQLQIVGWSLNSDERIELRKAIRRLIVANLPVFDGEGMQQINLSQLDVDAVDGEFNVPLYQVMSSFSCLAPVRVGGRVNPVTDITVRSTNG